jgi:hypothetical protein
MGKSLKESRKKSWVFWWYIEISIHGSTEKKRKVSVVGRSNDGLWLYT